jgi:hypothetical protein
MNAKRKTLLVCLTSLAVLLLMGAWSAFAGDDVIPDPRPSLSLEGIWTTMIQTPSGHASINSFVINAQGSEGLVYTCLGKHPQCSPTALGFFPESERLSDMLGYCVRTGADTFRVSVIYHGVKEGGPDRMGIGEIVYMAVLTGTAALTDSDTLVVDDATLAGYTPDQDKDGDRLPDEGAVPIACFASPLVFKRLPMFPSCEPTPLPFEMP